VKSEEKLFFEKLLSPDEQVLWTGRPLTKPYRIVNIERMLIDFVKVCAVYFVVYSAGYLLLQKDFNLREHIYNGALFLSVVLLIYIVRLIKKVAHAESVLYCITDERILIVSGRKKQKIKTIEKKKVKKKRIINSVTDREYKVQTVKLMIEDEDEDVLIENIENGDKVLELV
jgi:hypothetical protein